jgi:hypothetical protein
MAGEPSLDPPEPEDYPEPDEDAWAKWRLSGDEFYEWLQEEKWEDIEKTVHEEIIEPRLKGKPINKEKMGQLFVDLMNEFAEGGTVADFWDDHPPDEPDSDPPEPEELGCHPMYDGTGSPW